MAQVRISDHGIQVLKQLAASEGEPQQRILEKALEAYRRQIVIDQSNLRYGELKQSRAVVQVQGEAVVEAENV